MVHTPPQPMRDIQWIWGMHAVKAALHNPQRHILNFFLTSVHKDFLLEYPILKSNLSSQNVPGVMETVCIKLGPKRQALCHIVNAAYLHAHLPHGAVHQGMALQVKALVPLLLKEILPNFASMPSCFIVVFDCIIDPHNVGALWRSAAAFGMQAIVLTRHHCPRLDGVVAKTACGAIEQVPCVFVSNLSHTLQTFKAQGFLCLGLAEEAPQYLETLCKSTKVVLVIGSEEKGLRRLTRAQCDQLVSIATMPSFSTLNASVAGAIAMHHLYAQRVL